MGTRTFYVMKKCNGTVRVIQVHSVNLMRETVSNIHSKETRDQLMVVCVLLSNSVYVNDDMCASLCV